MSLGHAYKTWLDFGDLDLIFKSTGGNFIRNITENKISRKLFVCLPPQLHREQSQEFTMFRWT